MRDKEQWEWIKGFENRYLISTWGRVMGMPSTGTSGGLLVQRVSNSGYMFVALRENSRKSKYAQKYIHRLVAEAFIENPENKREVDHIDGNKLNNNVENLEWVTSSENKKRAYEKGLYPRHHNFNHPNKRAVIMDGSIRFSSIAEAAAAIGASSGGICRVLSGGRNHVHHHTFEYAD